MSIYNKIFYDNQEQGSLNSAKEVLPIIMDIIDPKSVIDVGCGLGTWLSVFKELGVDNILGLDGDWVDKNRILIPKESFIATDLENPIDLNTKFDLAISLEVAEHISHEYSEKFIEYLTEKAPVILFSAAIPLQGGTNHINEQWPEYWIDIFQKNNYQVIDCIRSKIWANTNIETWYIQNLFLFVEENYLNKNKKLKKELESNSVPHYSIVHPKLYLHKINHQNLEFEDQWRHFEEKLENQRIIFEKKIQNLEAQREDLSNELKSQKQLIQKILTSTSWKLTKPFRKIGIGLRNLKKLSNLYDKS